MLSGDVDGFGEGCAGSSYFCDTDGMEEPTTPPVMAGPRWFMVVVLSLLVMGVLLPFDGVITRAAGHVHLAGDVRRTLETLQQYGDAASVILVGLIIWLQDPNRRRALLDLALAAATTGLITLVAKMIIGRPRPTLGEPTLFLLPWRSFEMPIHEGGQPSGIVAVHAWEIMGQDVSRLWSMPSSHTSGAMALSVFLFLVYPRLKPLAIGMVVIVGVSRVLTTAHYPTDVVAGALVGWLVSWPIVRYQWGQRLVRRRLGDARL